MNINLSMEEIEIVRKALEIHRSSVSLKYSALISDGPLDSDEALLANQHRKAIGATLAKVEQEVSHHYSDYMVEQWRKANA